MTVSILPEIDQQIRSLLCDCGQQAERMAAKGFEVFEKGPEDYVTTIDAALDQLLFTAFSHWFPDDGVITEENTQSRQQFQASVARLWCIDPLDGTEDFIQRAKDYAVMVGLLQDYQPIAGWIHAPAHQLTYSGGPGWGLFRAIGNCPPQPLAAVEPPPPSSDYCPLIVGVRDQNRYGAAIGEQIPAARFSCLGSFGLKVMEVILGRAGLYLYFNRRVKLWDTAGPLALALAAGLECCDLDGKPIQFTPDRVDRDTLIHQQPILVGWASYIEPLRPLLQTAVEAVSHSLS